MSRPTVSHNSNSPNDGIRKGFDIDGSTPFPAPTRQIYCSGDITNITGVWASGDPFTINTLLAGTYSWEWVEVSGCTIPNGADFKGGY